jgi:hypothetical protein
MLEQLNGIFADLDVVVIGKRLLTGAAFSIRRISALISSSLPRCWHLAFGHRYFDRTRLFRILHFFAITIVSVSIF